MPVSTLTDSTTGAAAVGDDRLDTVELNVSILNNAGPGYDFQNFSDSTLIVDGTVASVNDEGVISDAGGTNNEIIVSEAGIVTGETGIEINDSDGSVINSGMIQGSERGLYVTGSGERFKLVNTGIIVASTIYDDVDGDTQGRAIQIDVDFASISNSGLISGSNLGLDINADHVAITNSGTIEATGPIGTTISDGSGFVINHSGADFALVNTGEILGNVAYGVATNAFSATGNGAIIENSGTIYALDQALRVVGQDGLTPNIINSGTIHSDGSAMYLDGDFAIFDVANSGDVAGEFGLFVVFAGLDLDNSGTITGFGGIAINTNGGALDDAIVSTGQILGDVELGDGVDSYILVGPGVTTGNVSLGDGDDLAIGAEAADVISGGNDADFISGGGGADVLAGDAGADIVLGGAGTDTISGGEGVDFLLGEEGADVFIFTSVSESPTGGDVTSILDFERGEDIIDLYSITLGIQFIGGDAFSGTGTAEVQTAEIGGVLTVVSFDSDGNGASDMEIIVYGAVDMDRADFGL